MENLKNGIKIEKMDVCPFFYAYDWDEDRKDAYVCKEEVNFLYVVEYCLKGFRKCRVFTQRTLTEMRTPKKWIETIGYSLGALGIDECFSVWDYIRCPMYPDCRVYIVYDHFEEKCCKDFDKCDFFMKEAYRIRTPADWSKNLKMLIYVEGDEDEDKDDEW